MSSGKLESRVACAAQAALDDHRYVSAIDLFLNMGWLSPARLAECRREARVAVREHMDAVIAAWCRECGGGES